MTKDDETIDLKSIKKWFKSNNTKEFFSRYGMVLLLLIPIILTIYLRLLPMSLPATETWAEQSVNGYYQNQITASVNAQYPNLPENNKKILIQNEFAKFKQENSAQLEQQIQGTAQSFKDKMMYESGDSKYVYLGDIDSYFWLRDARKEIENGVNCDEVDYDKGLCYQDTYSNAPLKKAIPLSKTKQQFYSKLILWNYKILRAFNQDITLMQASFYLQVIIGVLCAILAFFIGRLIAGNVGAVVASVMISANPIFLSRTLGSDNDPQNMLLPLLGILCFILMYKSTQTRWKLTYAGLSGLVIGIFSWAWSGWWFLFSFLCVSLVGYAGYLVIKEFAQHKKVKKVWTGELKTTILLLIAVVISSGIFITIFSSFNTFVTIIGRILWFTNTKQAALANYWPNVLVTVAEFNAGSIGTIIGQMGGKIFFFVGLLGMIFLLTNKQKMTKEQKYLLFGSAITYLYLASKYSYGINPMVYMALIAIPVAAGVLLAAFKPSKDIEVILPILLAIWFVATTYAALKGVRFTLLMVGPFGISFAVAVQRIFSIVRNWVSKELKINKNLMTAVLSLIVIMILVIPVRAGHNMASNYVPSMNDAWYDSLTKIKENSQEDAIINSWWDFGHWFKYVADRRVTLDGGSQSGPPLHWLGKLMFTKDEKQSMGIVRMLDCGSNTAFEKLNDYVKDTPASIKILDKIVTYDRQKARDTLIKIGLSEDKTDEVLEYTHCNPPEDFFITSEDMVGKAGVWGHFGSWDFNRAEMYQRVKGTSMTEGKEILSEEKYNLTPEEADKYYFEIQSTDGNQWISPWPGYHSTGNCQVTDEVIYCINPAGNGQQIAFEVNKTTMDAKVENTQGEIHPTSLVYVNGEDVVEKKFDGDVIEASLVLIPSGQGFKGLLVDPLLANSMFTRLFYLEGQGLKYFDKFDDRNSITNQRIIVWKLDWEGKDKNNAFTLKEETQNEENTTEAVETTELDDSVQELEEINDMQEDLESEVVEVEI